MKRYFLILLTIILGLINLPAKSLVVGQTPTAGWAEVNYTQKENSVEITNGLTKIVTEPGKKGVTGFRIYDLKANREVALLELTSEGRWEAKDIKVDRGTGEAWFIISNFTTSGTGNTPKFGAGSFVKVGLREGKSFPDVEFRIEIQSFDKNKWEFSWKTKCPFYFLRCTVDDANMFYHGGFLYPCLKTDPYPISFDAQMRGTWVDNWSYAVAMGAYNTPAVGLWASQNGKLVIYDFTHSRFTDKSDKFIASAYCAGQTDHPKQFFTLLYPYASQWTELRYPKGGEILSSHFDIIWTFDCQDWDDPQMFVLNRTYTEFYDLIPAVPSMSDLSWMGLKDATVNRKNVYRTRTEAGEPNLIGGPLSGVGDFWATLWAKGARPIGQTFLGDALEEAYRKKNKGAIDRIKNQLEELMAKPVRMKIGEDDCIAWNHPLEGSMSEKVGGAAATTIRHESTFHIGTAFLLVYKHEGIKEYLPFIDGVFNWCKHYLWTRNGVPDLPWAMFSRVATAAGESFLFNYYHIFKNDSQRSKNAERAIELARASTYKNSWYYLADPDESDNLDPTFLMQVVDSKWWIGQVTWAEGGYVIRTMIPVYCETGDPVLKYLLRGILERWWQGYNKDGYNFEENLEIFGEMNSKARRTLGATDPGHATACWRYALPVGGAIARVVVGRAAAICFDTGTIKIDIADYSYEPENNFQFKLAGDFPDSFALLVSAPFRDLRGQKVYVNNQILTEDLYSFNKMTDGEDVYILNVKCGDMVRIGELKEAKKIEIKPIKVRQALKEKSIKIGDFECLNPYLYCNQILNMKWRGENSWFGLIPGEHWFKGIPFYIVDPDLNNGKNAIDATGGISIPWRDKAKIISVVYGISPKDAVVTQNFGSITITYDDGTQESFNLARGLNALSNNEFPLQDWRAEMFIFETRKDLLVKEFKLSCKMPIFAISIAREKTPKVASSFATIEKEQKETMEKIIAQAKHKAEREALLSKCKDTVAKIQEKRPIKICLIPPRGDIVPVSNLEQDPGKLWPVGELIKKVAQDLNIQVDVPKVNEFVDQNIFNPGNYPISFYLGHEEYIRTFKEDGDGERALLNYLGKGGFLIVVGPGGTFPFFYPMDYSAGKWITKFDGATNFGQKFELFICGSGSQKGESKGFESPPSEELIFKLNKGQKVFNLLPSSLVFPREPDPRWRPVSGKGLPSEDEYIPIYSLENVNGEPYGQGIALIRHRCSDFNGANVLYFWGTLLDTTYAEGMLLESIVYAVQTLR